MMSSDDGNVTSCCVGSGSGSGGENKRRRTEITLQNSDENNSTDALLELRKEQLKAAQAELAIAQRNVEDLRQQIRSYGRYEADSLLRLSDGGDDHILAHIMCFLDVNDVGRCAMVCHALNKQSEKYWESFEARLLTHNSLRSPSATNSRERVVRYLSLLQNLQHKLVTWEKIYQNIQLFLVKTVELTVHGTEELTITALDAICLT
jgi:hypothetical protein